MSSYLDITGDKTRERKMRERDENRLKEKTRKKLEEKRNREHFEKHYGSSQDDRLRKKIPKSSYDVQVVKESPKRAPILKKEEVKTPRRRKNKHKGFTARRSRGSEVDNVASRRMARAGTGMERMASSTPRRSRGSTKDTTASRRHRRTKNDKAEAHHGRVDVRRSSNDILKREAGSPPVPGYQEYAKKQTRRDQGLSGGTPVENDADAQSRFRKRTWSEAKRHSAAAQIQYAEFQGLELEKRSSDRAARASRKVSEPLPTTPKKRTNRTPGKQPSHLIRASNSLRDRPTRNTRSQRLDKMAEQIDRQQKIIDEQRKLKMCGTWEYEVQGIRSRYIIEIDDNGDLAFHENLKNVGKIHEVLLFSDGWYTLFSRKLKFFIRLKLMGSEMLSQFRTKESKTWSKDIYATKQVDVLYE